MSRSSLRYALPLAGLLFVTPSEAAGTWGHRTVGEFVNLTPGNQVMFLGGALEATAALGEIRCAMPVNTGQVRDLIVNQVRLGRLERDDDLPPPCC